MNCLCSRYLQVTLLPTLTAHLRLIFFCRLKISLADCGIRFFFFGPHCYLQVRSLVLYPKLKLLSPSYQFLILGKVTANHNYFIENSTLLIFSINNKMFYYFFVAIISLQKSKLNEKKFRSMFSKSNNI